ncbi:hypothetical protein KY334_07195 [Candidatus Woesearchaeota archaeon]|nr:hypothetical protein [Candidatus Woesearchaeota archaeon]
MIIYKPKIKKNKDNIIIYSDIEFDNPKFQNLKKLWYQFPKSHEKFISNRSDGFLVALLPTAMSINEDLEIKGTISPKLRRGLEECQEIWATWWPEKFKRIKIKCENLKKHESKGKYIASCFSGGVDSFHTLYSFLNDSDPDYKITHALFIHGLEISLKYEENYNVALKSNESLIKKLNLGILQSKTNLLDFSKHIPGNCFGIYTCGVFLASTALILSNKISKFYIPSGYHYSNLAKEGYHPMTDHLLSTESLEIIHHGSSKRRTEKTEFISKIPETYSRLRVCGIKNIGLKNCCRCEKCLRTMITLKVQKKLHKYTTFPVKLTRKSIRNFPVNPHSYTFLKEILEYVISKGRKDIAFDIKYALIRCKVIRFKNKIKRKIKIFEDLELGLKLIWATMWKPSAYLKKKSKTYRRFVKFVKNDNS